MNFFEAQAKAKRHTFYFLILFALAIGGLIVLTNITVLIALRALQAPTYTEAFSTFMQASTPEMWLISSGLVLLIVFSGSLYMMNKLSAGGAFVASSLGGRKINTNTNDRQERQLLNVVQEMSIASGISVPSVYVLDDTTINAFAAGHSTDDVVIGVTQGLLDLLNRDELQGVIAHEFSHIFNGDMKLNMRLIGSLHGILLIGLIGESILRGLSHSRHSSRSSGNKKEGGNAVMIIIAVAVVFFVIGLLGKLLGSLIKAKISRQREYLADATAVQYTRYPLGIAGALKKIGSAQGGSEIHSPQASSFSHMYFANGVSGFFSNIFATHPPLKKRILAIEPRWDGKFPSLTTHPKDKEHVQSKQAGKREKKEQMATAITSATVGAKMASIGQPQDVHIQYARELTHSLPDALKDQISDPLGAQTLILALVSEDDKALRGRQTGILPQQMLLEFKHSLALLKEVKREHYLEVIGLCMPALKSSSKHQYMAFKSYLLHFIEIDKKVTLFEWCLQHIILRPLDRAFGFTTEIKTVHSSIGGLKDETELLFSMLAQVQYTDETEAKDTFDRIKKEIGLPVFEYVPKNEINFIRFEKSIAALETAKLPVKKRILEASLKMMMADEKLSHIEYEMIHAIAEILLIPLPPLQAK